MNTYQFRYWRRGFRAKGKHLDRNRRDQVLHPTDRRYFYVVSGEDGPVYTNRPGALLHYS